MSRLRILWVISLLVSTIFSFPNLSLSAQERRTALVIGNGSYRSAPLRNPVNDAEDMAKTLRKLGFTVIHKQNATQRDMETSIRKFGERLRKGGVGLFYYAGHGFQVNGINYIIPLDVEIREETDVKYEAVDARRVLDAMYNAGNDLNIVILDACRDNPLARGFRSGSSGLARMDAPKGTIIAYSTSPGKLALDGKGRNSPYTAALVDYMDDPGLTIEQVFKKCRRRIVRATNGKQIPWESTSLTGDFYFNNKGEMTIAKDPEQKFPPPETTKELNAVALVGEALAMMKDGKNSNPKRAIELLDKAIKLDPGYAKAYNRRGYVYIDLKQYDRALQDLDKAIELDPKNALAYTNRGIAYHSLEQYARAIQDYDKVLELSPDAFTYKNRGIVYFQLEQYARAIQDFDKAIDLDPSTWVSYSCRGMTYFELKQYARAIQDYNKALEFESCDKWIYLSRGRAYMKLQKVSRGCADLKKACSVGDCDDLEKYIKEGKCL